MGVLEFCGVLEQTESHLICRCRWSFYPQDTVAEGYWAEVKGYSDGHVGLVVVH